MSLYTCSTKPRVFGEVASSKAGGRVIFRSYRGVVACSWLLPFFWTASGGGDRCDTKEDGFRGGGGVEGKRSEVEEPTAAAAPAGEEEEEGEGTTLFCTKSGGGTLTLSGVCKAWTMG